MGPGLGCRVFPRAAALLVSIEGDLLEFMDLLEDELLAPSRLRSRRIKRVIGWPLKAKRDSVEYGRVDLSEC